MTIWKGVSGIGQLWKEARQSADGGIKKVKKESIQLKTLAQHLNIQSPWLYNRIKGLDDLRHELMLYGWRNMEERMVEAAEGVSGYAAWEAICRALSGHMQTDWRFIDPLPSALS